MSNQRIVHLECGKSTQVLYVLGTVINIDIYKPSPPGCRSFEVTTSPGVNYSISDKQNGSVVTHPAIRWALIKDSLLRVTVGQVSSAANDGKVKVTFYGDDLDKPVDKMTLELTAVYVSLDVDADRDGIVEENNPNKSSWMWGPEGHGAILLVNCDKELLTTQSDNMDDKVYSFADLADMSRMIIRTEGPKLMPAGYTLNLHISPSDKKKVQLFRHENSSVTSVLGRTKELTAMDFTKGHNKIIFSAEGLAFPHNKNATLVTFNLSVVHQQLPIFTDQVVLHFAPWIMTPNTQAPEEVYVCSVLHNEKFLIEFKKFVTKAQCKLTILPESENENDIWMQDEIEFGYIDAPHKFMNIVMDSPRNRGLKNFAYKFLLGRDFGRIDLKSDGEINSLDAFGNLEVSPPVTVNVKEYPFGRIVIGSHLPIHPKGRKMVKDTQDLLMAQSVQSPIILYSDWLYVGHVDEFMTFVPAPDRKGFRLLLASPLSFYSLFKRLQKEGHGEAMMFDNAFCDPIKVNDILKNQALHERNTHVQHCIDWNRDILKVELGLDEADIIDIPTLFKPTDETHVAAYFPDMVNMIVLGKYLGIPKPFGPLINGECALEAVVRSALEPLGLDCTFVNDFTSYHKRHGEVHCGSNVRRKPFTLKWWNMEI